MPAYSADGARLRDYSLESIYRCLALDPPSCVVKRHKRSGQIVSVTFKPVASSPLTIRNTAHMGQHYSVRQRLDDSAHHTWRFLTIRTEDRAVFLAVPLSCLKP